MAINFPTSLDSLSNPSPTDSLNDGSVPHATQHSDTNDAVEALEAKVGANSSGVTTSHDYKLSAVTGSQKAVSTGGAQTVAGLKTFSDGIETDTIAEDSAGAGVTIDGLLIKDGAVVGDISTDTISEENSGAGVTVDGVLLKDGEVNTDTINEENAGSGVTVDGVLLKDGQSLVPNNSEYQTKKAGGTTINAIKVDASDNLRLGENELRPSRFVPIVNPVAIVNTTSDSGGAWVTDDVTPNTSSRTFAISCKGWIIGNVTNAYVYAVHGDSASTPSDSTLVGRNQVTNTSTRSTFSFIVGTTTGQVWKYSLNEQGGACQVVIYVDGYFEYLD